MSTPPQGTRKRLDHIDAMRPIKQAAVISTHALIFFAPLATSTLATGVIMLTRFSRDAFLFVSASMLAYSYRESARIDYGIYAKRRLISVGLPYVVWTVLYFLFTSATPTSGFPYYSLSAHAVLSLHGAHYFWHLLATGYFHLYYLLVILEFYAIFPLLLFALRRAARWHVKIMWASVIWQVLYGWALVAHPLGLHVPGMVQTRLIISYPVYLVGGVIVALHLDDVHDWIVRHARGLVAATLGGVALGEGLLVLGRHVGLPSLLWTGSNVFAPFILPYNIGAILCVYLLGVFLVAPRRGPLTRSLVQSGSDNSYGVYLSQMIWIPILGRVFGALHLNWPWELRAPLALVIVYSMGLLLSTILARTPVSKAVVGRSRVSWATLRPHRVRTAHWHPDRGDGPLEVAAD